MLVACIRNISPQCMVFPAINRNDAIKTFPNAPKVKLALVGVSRDCFPIELTRMRLKALTKACRDKGLKVTACKTIIEYDALVVFPITKQYMTTSFLTIETV